jgi:hypothetical protein
LRRVVDKLKNLSIGDIELTSFFYSTAVDISPSVLKTISSLPSLTTLRIINHSLDVLSSIIETPLLQASKDKIINVKLRSTKAFSLYVFSSSFIFNCS